MKLGSSFVILLASSVWVFSPTQGAAEVIISEFMASNDASVLDEDRDFTDWIEIHNTGVAAVNLEGWYLTDQITNLTKWRFPAVTIGPRRFLLVFASDKNRRDPAYQLHTNFKLLSTGEFLGLIAPDGETIISSFTEFPQQIANVSYGYSQDSESTTIISAGAPARAIIPANGNDGTSWTQFGFDDGAWSQGSTGIGYDRNDDYNYLFGLDVGPDMDNVNGSAHIRIPFTLEDPSAVSVMQLRMKYDYGIVAYVNGQEVARRNAPSTLAWIATATGIHDDGSAQIFELIDIYEAVEHMGAGGNVLAVHGLNGSLGSSDFLILPELDAIEAGPMDTSRALYLESPTPGWANATGYTSVSSAPVFSHDSGVYTQSFSLALSAEAPGAVIRYTRDWSEPTASSPVYTGSLTIDASTMVRVKVFEPGAVPSTTVTRGYTVLDSSVYNFSSNLPLVVINTFGRGIGGDSYTGGYAEIIDTESGRSRLTGASQYSGIIGIKIRGSSSSGFPKKMYALELWDQRGNDTDASLLGLPAESDWVLYAPYSDKSLMRNALAYGWSNDIDEYAPRTRFVEMYLKTGTGALTSGDYVGVYLLVEKIKRDEDRVDIKKLLPSQDSEPEITGGYIMKIDRPDPGDVGFTTNRGKDIRYVEPKEVEITGPQRTWLKNYMDEFETALFGANWRDPDDGYARFIDVDSWVGHILITELCKNIDGYNLSTFFHKDRGGKIVMGPVWDFNLSLGNANY
ncbi:MAG: CotH kinase family protein, partial [bacterium]